ncbi:MAG: DUF3492 domain-containing protein [Candidatus Auribacter fodinae]|jgi:glycosyltransferase involved in cell wall biosynthesis|uniref:DUF3492 domain-containing protein n=1 Tax=Candidatus Auribacter fodinae TaxID=2093366 RepID=A0A3A4R9U4_9BACT|nr:MAG: DUF3492 domain-containing protein [Candidatus Auribacter fodinae]
MSTTSDVCLILEGTYPYVAGGVSSWVHQLVTALSDVRFSLLVILPTRDYIREFKYQMPSNIVDLRQIFIHDYEAQKPKCIYSRKKKEIFDELEKLIIEAVNGNLSRFEMLVPYLTGKENGLSLTIEDLIFSTLSWEMISNLYHHFNLNISFIDFFWTYRFTVMPLFNIFHAQIPDASIYHAISTGYAGILASIGKINQRAALILTEHGIYTRERKIEIAQASWIYDEKATDTRPETAMSFFKQWWTTFFGMMSILCYHHCNEIITLYEGNQIEQIKGGADPSRVSIIPNGIDLKGGTPQQRVLDSSKTDFVIGLVGRVVPIKDVKTFIKSCKVVLDALPDCRFLIMGPTDEDEEYYHECVALRDMLGMTDKITFTGIINVNEYYPKLDLLVLTSESEAQPLVILEAHAVGLPVVSSDVGSCQEMLYGRIPEDKAIGKSGLITGVGNPAETGEAIVQILSDPQQYTAMSKAGAQRVERFYNRDELFAKYLNLYDKYMF